ncbi:NADH:ubiquinone oxidoreductase subunit NDUFA12 [Siculibacillus lacustris]|uniref:NADH:ubiquinone oxidoreductase subunit NDUFA12 n=1 Tax=Siculibacillus lacustris TaxID=1549641 RepID=A0A4Q9VFH3_9HYPH|nr:NADH:ubiquinone oxidoreductase subunit NDUFA12 [Siculibacillus lacustris]TBW33653.1 NADH:ubiquinone oxidoreductase subunit NDUFA12 [Siculibacillus lacustris]
MKQLVLMLLTWWKGITFGTWVHTRLYGEFVGEDEFGNRYYRTKGGAIDVGLGFQRRWVIYKQDQDGSAIPPGWHGWMHHRVDTLPTDETYVPRAWEKPHLPNLTGTAAAHRPLGSLLGSGRRAATTDDYQAWKPE